MGRVCGHKQGWVMMPGQREPDSNVGPGVRRVADVGLAQGDWEEPVSHAFRRDA